eukprot:6490337-Amphidinium_carterae.3
MIRTNIARSNLGNLQKLKQAALSPMPQCFRAKSCNRDFSRQGLRFGARNWSSTNKDYWPGPLWFTALGAIVKKLLSFSARMKASHLHLRYCKQRALTAR